MSNLSDMINRGDWAAAIGASLNARMESDEGHFCACKDPCVTGLDLMCGNCLLEVESQREKREAAHNAPHAYVPMAGRDFGMCDFCTRWKDDPIHQEATDETK